MSRSITVAVGDVAKARRAALARDAVADGVVIARDLVNEPANVLYPEEFARRAGALKKLGVVIDVVDERDVEKARHERAARRRAGLCA